jgi:hypothetical protein
MRRALALHPDGRCDAVARIDVEVARTPNGDLLLGYAAYGRIRDVRVPPLAPSERTDELWRRTCFEAFLRGPGEAYIELNFSPSTEWAVYTFDDYRVGMAPARPPGPRVEAVWSEDRLDVVAAVSRTLLAAHPAWRLGLAAVIEETDGRISYWALAHPPGTPDFHHDDGFAFALP